MIIQTKVAPKRQIVLVSLLVFAIAAGISGFLLEQNKKAKASGAYGTWKLEILRPDERYILVKVLELSANEEGKIRTVGSYNSEGYESCDNSDEVFQAECYTSFQFKKNDRIKLIWNFPTGSIKSKCIAQGDHAQWRSTPTLEDPTNVQKPLPKAGFKMFILGEGRFQMSIRCSEPDPVTGLYGVPGMSDNVWQSGKFIVGDKQNSDVPDITPSIPG